MPHIGFATGETVLVEAARLYFVEQYEGPTIHEDKEISAELEWTPHLYFHPKRTMTIAAEVGETPYPQILQMRVADIINVQMPIAVYSICSYDVFAENPREVKRLREHGYGLLTVNTNGEVTRQFGCIPLIQHYPENEFSEDIKKLPRANKLAFKEAYDVYREKAAAGLMEAGAIVENLVNGATKQAVAKGWLEAPALDLSLARKVDELASLSQFSDQTAAFGGVRWVIKNYRNIAGHPARSRKAAYDKFRQCRRGFQQCIEVSASFCASLKQVGLRPIIVRE